MTQGLPQWIAEVQTLQQQVAELQQEREQAESSAMNWRQLYESEAQQRRQDAAAYQEQLTKLQEALSQLEQPVEDHSDAFSQIVQTVEQFQSQAILKTRLIDALKLCDRLSTALKAEQENHAQTRDGLMTALGDAIDLLANRSPLTEDNPGQPD